MGPFDIQAYSDEQKPARVCVRVNTLTLAICQFVGMTHKTKGYNYDYKWARVVLIDKSTNETIGDWRS